MGSAMMEVTTGTFMSELIKAVVGQNPVKILLLVIPLQRLNQRLYYSGARIKCGSSVTEHICVYQLWRRS